MKKDSRTQRWRKMGSRYKDGDKYDSELHGPRWYRFGGKLPEERVEDKSCGTEFAAWLQDAGHPTPEEGIVNRTICFGKHCGNPTQIRVAACNIDGDSYYVYELEKTKDNDSGYCWEPERHKRETVRASQSLRKKVSKKVKEQTHSPEKLGIWEKVWLGIASKFAK